MDDIVKQALARWPNVPHCTGWLMLDARGNWRMRDEAAQAGNTPGTAIRHDALLGFINRNYERDANGQWYFQNGPQRVYVELEYTPWIVRLASDASGALTLTDQAGQPFEPAAAWLDEAGSVIFADAGTPPRAALLHDHDLDLFSDHATLADDARSGTFHWRADRALPLQAVKRADVPASFAFVQSPARAEREAQGDAHEH
ncbi:DUF2946 family protein [Paraburkholderia unamae]|uniref:DUF2946 family protein n=1 Tax=Paraburkholderia unamae TaxID=219649 RepID=A0ABX5KIV4_9BURK|nr:DUF2946 family protein [Paraburkholderia unamae]PVX77913.1 hypothetical protein C7402_114142 [Paraburkholderia unamae]CAG9270645.1 conserved hypothetical protein [Paraburkholderia unamae]